MVPRKQRNRKEQRSCGNCWPSLTAKTAFQRPFHLSDLGHHLRITRCRRANSTDTVRNREQFQEILTRTSITKNKLSSTDFAQGSAKLWRSRCQRPRRELCKSSPEWIWVEPPSTTRCWTSRRSSSLRACLSIQLWRSRV